MESKFQISLARFFELRILDRHVMLDIRVLDHQVEIGTGLADGKRKLDAVDISVILKD